MSPGARHACVLFSAGWKGRGKVAAGRERRTQDEDQRTRQRHAPPRGGPVQSPRQELECRTTPPPPVPLPPEGGGGTLTAMAEAPSPPLGGGEGRGEVGAPSPVTLDHGPHAPLDHGPDIVSTQLAISPTNRSTPKMIT